MKINMLLAIALCFFSYPVVAQEALFTTEVAVDALGKDPVDARDQALLKAEREGLSALLEKFAPDLRGELIASLDDNAINGMLNSKEVITEALNGNRYRADVRLNFSALKVNALIEQRLKDAQNDKANRTPSTLVLPILVQGEKRLLFESGNLWRKAWIDSSVSHRNGALVLPFGDVVDASMMNGKKMLESHYKDITPMLRRFGARDAVVALVTVSGQEKKYVLDIEMRRIQASNEEITHHRIYGDPEQDIPSLFMQGAQAMAEEIFTAQNTTLDAIRLRDASGGSQMLVVGVTTPKHYTEFRKKLEALPSVEKVTIVAFSAAQVDMLVRYKEKPEALQDALKTMRMQVAVFPNYWTVEEMR